jgi:Rieske Fe-S protein
MRKKSLQDVSALKTRREFLSDVTVSTSLGILGVCGVGCKTTWSNHEVVVELVSRDQELEVDLNQYSDLKKPGGYLPIADLSYGLRVLVVHSLSGGYLAFNMSCTHKGADVELDKHKTGLVCPLHKSHFSLEGERVSGPARRDLETFEAIQDGSVLRINLKSKAT